MHIPFGTTTDSVPNLMTFIKKIKWYDIHQVVGTETIQFR